MESNVLASEQLDKVLPQGTSETKVTPSQSTGKETVSKSTNEEKNILEDEFLTDSDLQKKEADDIFCFETDHVALKGNPDYQELLKTVALLEAQRTQAIQDLDTLLKSQTDALADPITFVHKLQQKQDLGLPRPQKLAELPTVQWSRYTSKIGSFSWSHKHRTRYKKQVEESSSAVSSRSNTPTSFFPPEPSFPTVRTSGIKLEPNSSDESKLNLSLVRGKTKDVSKPSTFNQLWTADEQRRLEELLIKYPPEEVEARRWEKIAKELGNRTKFQVQSRMQKYLLRLAREGLPLPGRMPHMTSHQRRRLHLHQKHNRLLYPQSTMCISYKPPVYMSDDEDSSNYSNINNLEDGESKVMDSNIDISDEEDIPEELRNSAEYKEILKLKREKVCQLQRAETLRHIGYACDKCGAEPIIGTRWHCTDCPEQFSVDFCDDCSDFVYETDHHKTNHHLEPVRNIGKDSSHIDMDYQHSQFIPGDYNYLDPNYMPAS